MFALFARRAFCSSARRCSQRSQEKVEAYKRKRQAEWKRKQGGSSFLDHLIVTVRGGKGGDGCAAYHREKFKPFGPPSGGNGGKGGAVYFLPTPTLTTLSTIPNRIRGHNGQHGMGTWQNGKAERMREKRWLHYPGYAEVNVEREDFKEAEAAMYKLERERRLARRRRLDSNPIYLDLDKEEGPQASSAEADNAPLGIRHQEYLGHLIAHGGQGGVGNPHFVSSTNRTPRYATRGHEGERVTLLLELKLLADIGLVGMPNAGKSTLLRALTGGRAKTDVAGYAFTTLNPVVGIVRLSEDGTFEGELVPEETVYDETKIESQTFEERMKRGEFANTPTRNQLRDASPETSSLAVDPHADSKPTRPGHHFDLYESFRFTIADNPGLIENSSSPSAHAGLGNSFLRAIERSPALVCVVDFSSGQQPTQTITSSETTDESDAEISSPPAEANDASPVDDVIPSTEPRPLDPLYHRCRPLRSYQDSQNRARGVSRRNVVSHKNAKAIEEAKARLARLEEYARRELGDDVVVVPVSAKYKMNLRKVVALMKGYAENARKEKLAAQKAACLGG
ncbi:hypothetical protein NP233_g8891 [Leucocoprinus birnbaumii]|uniref:GTPase n=1 Tax=Leucocoprinus birnbaumii TaxID=56174 RepID=A0AAD5YRE7_9AGAR|nr:hypothetical protein NP233_g8891 [Leucocoprinus birnbaumii]